MGSRSGGNIASRMLKGRILGKRVFGSKSKPHKHTGSIQSGITGASVHTGRGHSTSSTVAEHMPGKPRGVGGKQSHVAAGAAASKPTPGRPSPGQPSPRGARGRGRAGAHAGQHARGKPRPAPQQQHVPPEKQHIPPTQKPS